MYSLLVAHLDGHFFFNKTCPNILNRIYFYHLYINELIGSLNQKSLESPVEPSFLMASHTEKKLFSDSVVVGK